MMCGSGFFISDGGGEHGQFGFEFFNRGQAAFQLFGQRGGQLKSGNADLCKRHLRKLCNSLLPNSCSKLLHHCRTMPHVET